ncbi:HET-domain-containing protein [Glonium stellatum]|uniref:HET-domain-containing protein n=1 Tax=Glonium stellatum TaxID=574774 RepID=A0A8E2JQ22_9PEZI|nr:HET-domain-containing protein [Glonium stellatum]
MAVPFRRLQPLDIVKFYYGYDRLCSVCAKLDLREGLRPANPKTSGPPLTFVLEDFWLTSKYCPLCRLLFLSLCTVPGYLIDVCRKKPPGWVCHVISRQEHGRVVSGDAAIHSDTRQLMPFIVWKSYFESPQYDPPALSRGVQILADENDNEEASCLLLGRWLDIPKADVRLMKSWISDCRERHGSACAHTSNEWALQEDFVFRLIDVQRRCVVDCRRPSAYVALSYVWGDAKKAKHLKLTTQTASWLYGENSLTEDNPEIPKTIKDAISVVEELGEHYLWVDAICIRQDDDTDKLSQIPVMNRIYGSAKFTIIAGSGSDAWAGLTGAGLNPAPRSSRQTCGTIHGIPLVTIQQHYRDWLANNVWNSRGWTFQEGVLSKRCLIFTDTQVFFRCGKALWYEDTILENFSRDVFLNQPALESYSSGSPFTGYEILVMRFTHRVFGCQADALYAFRGLENYLQQLPAAKGRAATGVNLASGFHWGLPESMFDAAICWAWPYHHPDRRRAMFPSWSWAGWDFSGIYNGYYVSFPMQDTIYREVVWYKVMDDRGTTLPIDNSVLAYMDSRITKEETSLTHQWKREDSEVPSNCNMTPLADGKALHIIQFWTSSACLPVDRTGPQVGVFKGDTVTDPSQNNELMAVRHPITNSSIGAINLHREWRAKQAENLEFIVLARCCKHRSRPDYMQGLYVMLIDRIDGVAYRVQITQYPIREDAWISVNPEWKLISLA